MSAASSAALADAWWAWRTRAKQAETLLHRIREMHPQHDTGGYRACTRCGVAWPCPTIHVLDGTGQNQ